MTSPPSPCSSRSAASVTRLADEPELTNTLCFTPSHARPLLLERADVLRLREDRVVLLEQIDHRVEVFAGDVVLHQRPGQLARRGASGRHVRPLLDTLRFAECPTGRKPRTYQNGPLNSMLCRSARSAGSQPRRAAFDQVARGGGDGPGVGVERVFQRRRRRAGRRGEAHPLEAEVARSPWSCSATRGDDLGRRPAVRPRRIDDEQPARLARPSPRWCRCRAG